MFSVGMQGWGSLHYPMSYVGMQGWGSLHYSMFYVGMQGWEVYITQCLMWGCPHNLQLCACAHDVRNDNPLWKYFDLDG